MFDLFRVQLRRSVRLLRMATRKAIGGQAVFRSKLFQPGGDLRNSRQSADVNNDWRYSSMAKTHLVCRRPRRGDLPIQLRWLWANMMSRCYRTSDLRYFDYGGRGITICDEWRFDCEAFYDWAVQNGWKTGKQIDRIDNNGNYNPENCRFVTPKENMANRRNVVTLTAFGETKMLVEWLDDARCKVTDEALRSRISRGWPVESAISAPPSDRSPKFAACAVCGTEFKKRRSARICCSTECARQQSTITRFGRS